MDTHSLTQFAPDTEMLVHPVYLAGRGDAQIHNELSAARGWGKAITDTGVVWTSPCQTVHVAYLPESRHGGWKVTQYREPLGMPLWSAEFSENTPAEITSAFTSPLANGLGSKHRDYLYGGPHYFSAGPADVLVGQGWTHDANAMFQYQRSPDGHSYFSLRKYHLDDHIELDGGGPAQWTMYGCVDKVNGERWHANFTGATPLYLVTRSVIALSSPEPVERPLHGIPDRNLPYVTARPVAADHHPRQSAALARTLHAPQPASAPLARSAAGGTLSPAPSHQRRR